MNAALRAESAKSERPELTMGDYVESNKLDLQTPKNILDKHAPGNDAADDGVYDQTWLGTD